MTNRFLIRSACPAGIIDADNGGEGRRDGGVFEPGSVEGAGASSPGETD